MKMKFFLPCLTALFFASSANAVLINFDDHASTTNISGTPTPESVVTTEYSSDGVVFGRAGVSAGVAVINNGNTFSVPNGACGLDALGNITDICTGDLYFNFVDGVNNAATDFVSFVIGDSGGDLDGWIINVFDLADNLLEARSVTSEANTLQTFAHTGMHRFHLDWTDITGGGYLFDDLSFNTPGSTDVPESMPFVLMLVGLIGLGVTRRLKA